MDLPVAKQWTRPSSDPSVAKPITAQFGDEKYCGPDPPLAKLITAQFGDEKYYGPSSGQNKLRHSSETKSAVDPTLQWPNQLRHKERVEQMLVRLTK